MFSFSMSELIVVLVVVMVVFGPAKLPEIGKAIGSSMRDFKAAMTTEPEKEKSADK